jgi:ElaA protein
MRLEKPEHRGLSIEWQWCDLADLSPRALYEICAAREAVFVVEQNCAYMDLDGRDVDAHHLIGWSGSQVAAYLRVLPPGVRFAERSIGRVMTAASFRSQGLGRRLMQIALERLDREYPGEALRISAQAHLESFYAELGFVRASDLYMEDQIPHIEMLRIAS